MSVYILNILLYSLYYKAVYWIFNNEATWGLVDTDAAAVSFNFDGPIKL